MPIPLTIPAVSVEYAHGTVTSDVTLGTQTVEVAFLGPTAAPDATTTWHAAEWEGAAGLTRSWRLLIGPGTDVPLAAGQYSVWVRVADVTETPIRRHEGVATIL